MSSARNILDGFVDGYMATDPPMERKRKTQAFVDAMYPAVDALAADLAAARARERELREVIAPLLAAAEAEVGPKTPGSEDRDAEYWARQSTTHYQVPGVQRRIALARAVIVARAALAAEPAATLAEPDQTERREHQRPNALAKGTPSGSASAAADEPGERP